MDITVSCEHPHLTVPDSEQLQEVLKKACYVVFSKQETQFSEGAYLNVVLCEGTKVTELNRAFLNKDYETDVLAFDLQNASQAEMERGAGHNATEKSNLAAEIYVNGDIARENAPVFGVTWYREVMLYIVHGLLHIKGHRDDNEAAQTEMTSEENRVIEVLQHNYSLDHLFSWRQSKKEDKNT